MNLIKLEQLHTEIHEDLLKCGVYTITNAINGKMYVGSTASSFLERWRSHAKSLKKGNHHSSKLQRAVNKYGILNFKFEILDITLKEHATSIERYWFNNLNPVKLGYNVSNSVNGGCLGCKMSSKHRKIIAKVNKNNNHFLNYKHSEKSKTQIKGSTKKFYENDSEYVKDLKEQRRKNVIVLNKTVFNKLNKIPIVQIDLKTNEIIKEWESATDASKVLGILATSITKTCKGKSQQAYGFKWAYK